MQCPNCGAQANGKFCEYCGSEIPRIAPETVNNDNSNTTIINNYYQSSPPPIRQPEYVPAFDAHPKPKTPFWKEDQFLLLICILMPYVGVFLLWITKKPLNKTVRIITTIFLVFYSIGLFALIEGTESENQKDNNSALLETYTDISDFEYSINENNELVLESYKGKDSILKIENQYEIDGKSYDVTDLSEFQIDEDSVTTFIVSDGITKLNDSIFNGCNVSKIYLPKSLSIIYDNTLAYLSEDKIDIYYEGTKKEWKNIFAKYQAKSVSEEWKKGNAEESGKALADKINSFVGHEYDSSKFTFHYESNMNDIN